MSLVVTPEQMEPLWGVLEPYADLMEVVGEWQCGVWNQLWPDQQDGIGVFASAYRRKRGPGSGRAVCRVCGRVIEAGAPRFEILRERQLVWSRVVEDTLYVHARPCLGSGGG